MPVSILPMTFYSGNQYIKFSLSYCIVNMKVAFWLNLLSLLFDKVSGVVGFRTEPQPLGN